MIRQRLSPHGSGTPSRSDIARQRDSVAERHRTECETIVTPLKRPERRAEWGKTAPCQSARGAPLKTATIAQESSHIPPPALTAFVCKRLRLSRPLGGWSPCSFHKLLQSHYGFKLRSISKASGCPFSAAFCNHLTAFFMSFVTPSPFA